MRQGVAIEGIGQLTLNYREGLNRCCSVQERKVPLNPIFPKNRRVGDLVNGNWPELVGSHYQLAALDEPESNHVLIRGFARRRSFLQQLLYHRFDVVGLQAHDTDNA